MSTLRSSLATASLALVQVFVVASCEKNDDGPKASTEATPSDDKSDNKNPKADDPKTDGAGSASERPTVEMLETPRERRLHSDRVSASSFLWNDWNRFQENYHPLYLVDDDPTTAWVEGATGHGEKEWVRVHLTTADETTAVRLRLRNGYHKSKSLHKKNGRAKSLRITLLPSKEKTTVELEDNMEWQEFSLKQKAGKLEAVQFDIEAVHRGSKYADLCLSDLEVFATSRIPENPQFEKRKFESVATWKNERIAAAKLFTSTSASEMPIARGYKVVGAKKVKAGDFEDMDSGASIAKKALTELGQSAELKIAEKAFASNFKDWVAVEVSVKNGRKLPAVDGLARFSIDGESDLFEPFEKQYVFPAPGKLEFLTSSRLSSFESTSKISVKRALTAKFKACKKQGRDHWFYFRPKAELASGDGTIKQLLVVQCGMVEMREGYFYGAVPQLLVYADDGKLAASVTPHSAIVFRWDQAVLSGGKRLWLTSYDYDDTLTKDELKIAVAAK